MNSCRGSYYDGKSTACHPVALLRAEGMLYVSGRGVELRYPLTDLKVAPPLAGVRRSLRLPGGAMVQADDDRDLERLLGEQGTSRFWKGITRWERSVPLALVALLLTGALVGVMITWVIPAVVRQAAYAISPGSERRLGDQTLQQLDRIYLSPSKLPLKRQAELSALLDRMAPHWPEAPGYRLQVRDGEALGANAFALPGGTIVFTDDLVKLARNDNELLAILAHEGGHIRHRHAMRQLLQSSAAGILIAALTGDITSVTSLGATLPATLVNADYSRDFEYEADDAAVLYLKRAGVSPKVFAEILGRLEKSHRKEGSEVEFHLFDTHPTTDKRIDRILAAVR